MTKSQAENLLNLYGGDILESEGMNLEKQFIQHGGITVFEHSLAVAVLCLRIADVFSIRVERSSLIRGALLHDYFLYDWHVPDKTHRLHGFHHAKSAAQNADRDFRLNPIERNMIITHMFPLNTAVPRYRESLILCVADKICASKEIIKGIGRRQRKDGKKERSEVK